MRPELIILDIPCEQCAQIGLDLDSLYLQKLPNYFGSLLGYF